MHKYKYFILFIYRQNILFCYYVYNIRKVTYVNTEKLKYIYILKERCQCKNHFMDIHTYISKLQNDCMRVNPKIQKKNYCLK